MNEPLLEPEPLVPSRNVSAYEHMVQRLSEMGFESRLVDVVINFTGASSVEEVIDYLLKGENGWNHSFLPHEDFADRCLICNDRESEHAERRPSSSSMPSPMLHDYEYSNIENPCSICYDEMQNAWSHPNCVDHSFCRNCITEFLNLKISESQVTDLRCPGNNCGCVFTEDLISALVSASVFEKYLKFKRRAEIMKDPSVRWCLTPNCEGYARGHKDKPKLVCPFCNAEMCFRCGEAWHSGSCEEAVDRAYEKWAMGREVQLCPRCRHRIEKIEGCNHMTCTMCNYQWCWLCRGAYSTYHYNFLNPFGCSNLQGGDNTRAQWPLYRIYLKRLASVCYWFLIIVFFPLILWSIPAFIICQNCNIELRYRQRSAVRYLIYSSVFVVIFILTPIVAALALPVVLVYGINYIIKRIVG